MKSLQGAQKDRLIRAAEETHAKDSAYKRAGIIDFIIYILIVVAVAFAIRNFVGEPILVDGYSMQSTLSDTERLLVEKVSYWFGGPQRGDIVVCYYPGYTTSCVKRVIGLPGETVEVRENGVYINGALLSESAYWNGPIYDTALPTVVPENHVYVMGDNRFPGQSLDSRNAQRVGCIPYNKILGKAVCVIWPFSNIRGL